jgi:hypothetical protein
LRDTWPDVGFRELKLELGLELRAVSLVPVLSELPEVLENLETTLIGQNGFRVILDSPEGLRKVANAHANVTVVLIL